MRADARACSQRGSNSVPQPGPRLLCVQQRVLQVIQLLVGSAAPQQRLCVRRLQLQRRAALLRAGRRRAATAWRASRGHLGAHGRVLAGSPCVVCRIRRHCLQAAGADTQLHAAQAGGSHTTGPGKLYRCPTTAPALPLSTAPASAGQPRGCYGTPHAAPPLPRAPCPAPLHTFPAGWGKPGSGGGVEQHDRRWAGSGGAREAGARCASCAEQTVQPHETSAHANE